MIIASDATEHGDFVALAKGGRILIGFDRSFSRRFYADTPVEVVKANTGEAPYVEKLVVFGSFIGAPVVLITASIAAVAVLAWWALLVIPLGLITWLRYYLNSSRGDARLRGMSILVGVVALGSVFDFRGYGDLFAVLALYLGAMWLGRFVYVSATTLLRAFIIRNARAYTWLRAEIVTRDAAE